MPAQFITALLCLATICTAQLQSCGPPPNQQDQAAGGEIIDEDNDSALAAPLATEPVATTNTPQTPTEPVNAIIPQRIELPTVQLPNQQQSQPSTPFTGTATLENMPYAEAFGMPVGPDGVSMTGWSICNPVNGKLSGSSGTRFTGHFADDYCNGSKVGGEVFAIADGVIYTLNRRTTSNWMDVIIIKHRVRGLNDADEYLYSMYGHMKVAQQFQEGQFVTRRTKIAETTEIYQNQFLPHLHMELRNTIATTQCEQCSASKGIGTGYSHVPNDTFNTAAGYYDPSDSIQGNRYYKTDAFIKARLPAGY